jgi:hypothetical protein
MFSQNDINTYDRNDSFSCLRIMLGSDTLIIWLQGISELNRFVGRSNDARFAYAYLVYLTL